MSRRSATLDEPEAAEGWFSRERAMALALLALTLVLLFLCYRLAVVFLPALAWALALAIIGAPLHARLERRVRHRGLAAGLAVFVVAIVVVVPVIFVVQNLINQAVAYAQILQEYAAGDEFQQFLVRHPWLQSVADLTVDEVDLQKEVQSATKQVAVRLPGYVGGSLWVLAQLLVTLLALFYFLRDRRSALQSLRHLLPFSNRETDRLFDRIDDTVYATIFGSVSMAMLQGMLGGLIFWLLDLPSPLLWGTIMALLALVPMLGTFIVWLPAAIGLALLGDWGKAMVIVAWGAVAIGLLDNLLYPWLVGKRLQMHPLLVFVAIVGGVSQFGAAGIVLGPLVVAVAQAVLDVWRQRTENHGTVENGA